MVCSLRLKKVLLLSIWLISNIFTLPVLASNAPTKLDNAVFKEAVQAVKDKKYAHAIKLFETQAKVPHHDAQHNLAVLLNAGKGRPRNYVEALYWSWQAQLGGIEDSIALSDDIVDLLPPKSADEVRERVGKALQERIESRDLQAIPQFANYHLTILNEPDYANAYIWFSIAVALGLPNTIEDRDDAESQIDSKQLVEFQIKTQELFDKYKFKKTESNSKGEKNES